LAQDGNGRPYRARDVGRGDVLLWIECERGTEPRVAERGAGRELRIRALGIIAQAAHLPGCFGPGAAQIDPGLIEAERADGDAQPQVGRFGSCARWRADAQGVRIAAVARQNCRYTRLRSAP